MFTNMKLVLILIIALLASIEACHPKSRHKRNKREEQVDVIHFFTKCLSKRPSLKRVEIKEIINIVRFTVTSDRWMEENCIDEDTAACWQRCVSRLLNHNSRYNNPTRRCMVEYETKTRGVRPVYYARQRRAAQYFQSSESWSTGSSAFRFSWGFSYNSFTELKTCPVSTFNYGSCVEEQQKLDPKGEQFDTEVLATYLKRDRITTKPCLALQLQEVTFVRSELRSTLTECNRKVLNPCESNTCEEWTNCAVENGTAVCKPICGHTEVYKKCASSCQTTCGNLDTDSFCILSCHQRPCECAPGYIRLSESSHTCVKKTNCPVCENNNCHVKAYCDPIDSENFKCVCMDGYKGIGTKCKKIRCERPIEPTHGKFEPIKVAYDQTDQIRFHCLPGFTISGVQLKNCSITGEFVPNGSTKCTDVNECTASTHNCHIHATCVNNIGSYRCVCKQGYTGNGRMCKQIRCERPIEPTHGKFEPIKDAYDQTDQIRFHCLPGFAISGIQLKNCSITGEFVPNGNTKCTDVNECTKATHTCHAQATCVNNIGSYNCVCKAGYTGDGRICNTLGCGLPIPTNFGYFVEPLKNFYPVGHKLQIKCNNGYQARGLTSYSILCGRAGKKFVWKGGAKCSRITTSGGGSCGMTQIANGRIVGLDVRGNIAAGGTISFLCNGGYKRVGPRTRKCFDYGWVGGVPRCEAMNTRGGSSSMSGSCGISGMANGRIQGLDSRNNVKLFDWITIICNHGYSLTGAPKSQCTTRGFSPSPGRCINYN